MTGRSVPEWIGKTPDTVPPRSVKLRIWQREGGRCYLSGRKIMPGDTYEFEHKLSLGRGGENRESNIFLALTAPHKEKSAEDARLKAKEDRIHAKHNGYFPPSKTPLKSGRGFPKRWEARS